MQSDRGSNRGGGFRNRGNRGGGGGHRGFMHDNRGSGFGGGNNNNNSGDASMAGGGGGGAIRSGPGGPRRYPRRQHPLNNNTMQDSMPTPSGAAASSNSGSFGSNRMGDIEMQGGQHRTPYQRGGQAANSTRQHVPPRGPYHVTISGFRDASTVLAELQSKSSKQLNFSEQTVAGDKIKVTLRERMETIALVNLSGIRIAGAAITIMLDSSDGKIGPTLPPHLSEKVFGYLESKCSPDKKLLDCTNLLTNINSNTEIKFDWKHRNCVHTVLRFIEQRLPDVQTIAFGSNDIDTLQHFKGIQQAAPRLENLSFFQNRIGDMKELDALRGLQLRELDLRSNPVSNGSKLYENEAKNRFPTLKVLDTRSIASDIEFALPIAATYKSLPAEAQPHSYGKGVRTDLVQGFLAKYFRLFDERNDGLFHAYHPNGMFSLSLVEDTKKAPAVGVNVDAYRKISRNLACDAPDSRYDELRMNRTNVLHTLCQLPRSRHQIEKLTCDASVIGGTQYMLVNVSGHYIEIDSNQPVMFLRTFTLAMSSANPEWPVVICNDQFCVNLVATGAAIAAAMAMTPQPPQAAAAAAQQQQQQQVLSLANLNEGDRILVHQVHSATGCTVDIAMSALTQTQGNVQNAINLVRQTSPAPAAAIQQQQQQQPMFQSPVPQFPGRF